MGQTLFGKSKKQIQICQQVIAAVPGWSELTHKDLKLKKVEQGISREKFIVSIKNPKKFLK